MTKYRIITDKNNEFFYVQYKPWYSVFWLLARDISGQLLCSKSVFDAENMAIQHRNDFIVLRDIK